MLVNIPQLKILPFLQEELEVLLRLEDFVKFWIHSKAEGDTIIRADNIKRIRTKQRELRYVNGSPYITFQGLLICIINRKDDFQNFKSIFDTITKILT